MTKKRPETDAGVTPTRPETDAEATEDHYVSDCEVCGDPIDYCQGHGEIASTK